MRITKCWSLILASLTVLVLLTVSVVSAAPAKITIWSHLDRPDLPYVYDLIAEFNRTHPHIEAEFELVPWGSARDKYITSIIAGNPADVIFYATPVWGGEFWEMGALEPLDGYIQNWEGADDIADSAWASSRVSPDAPIFGVPFISIPGYAYYRKDWFEEAGVTVPETSEQFLEAALKVTQDLDGDGNPDRFGFGMRGARGGNSMWASFVLAALPSGQEWFLESGESSFTHPDAVAANQFYVDLHRTHKVTPPSAPQDGFSQVIQGFTSGKTAMTIHHLMSSSTMVEALGEDKVGVMKVPSVNGRRVTDFGLHHWVIPSASKQKDAAFEFVAWLSSAPQVRVWSQGYGTVPLVNSIAGDPYYRENEFARVSLESVQFAIMPPYIDTFGRWAEQVWPATIQRALLGQISSEQMMDILAEEIVDPGF